MTLYEVTLCMKGYAARLKDQKRLLAWHACCVMSPHVKKSSRLTPGRLLGEKISAMNMAPGQYKAHMEKRAKHA